MGRSPRRHRRVHSLSRETQQRAHGSLQNEEADRSGTHRRSRSISVPTYLSQSDDAAAGNFRTRQNTLASLNRDKRTRNLGRGGEVSALSVELANVRTTEHSSTCFIGSSHNPVFSRVSGSSIQRRRTAGDNRDRHHERKRRSMSQVEPAITSHSDHDYASDGEQWHPRQQHVIRARRDDSSARRPSVLELFNITPPTDTGSVLSPSRDDAKHSFTAGEARFSNGEGDWGEEFGDNHTPRETVSYGNQKRDVGQEELTWKYSPVALHHPQKNRDGDFGRSPLRQTSAPEYSSDALPGREAELISRSQEILAAEGGSGVQCTSSIAQQTAEIGDDEEVVVRSTKPSLSERFGGEFGATIPADEAGVLEGGAERASRTHSEASAMHLFAGSNTQE